MRQGWVVEAWACVARRLSASAQLRLEELVLAEAVDTSVAAADSLVEVEGIDQVDVEAVGTAHDQVAGEAVRKHHRAAHSVERSDHGTRCAPGRRPVSEQRPE